MTNETMQARVLSHCLFNETRYTGMFTKALVGAGDAYTFDDICPEVVELVMLEAIATMVYMQEGMRKKTGDLHGKRRVLWQAAIEACNEGLCDATTAVPDVVDEKGDHDQTPCSKLLASFPADPAKSTDGRRAISLLHWSVIARDVECQSLSHFPLDDDEH